MDVQMVFEPGKVVTWDEFRHYPPFSMAIDGYCAGRPRASADGLRLNINHHEEVYAPATLSSCEQAYERVKRGIYRRFCENGRPKAILWNNACDADVVYTNYTFMNPDHVDRPLFLGLIGLEGKLDRSSGLYPVKRTWHLLRRLCWTIEPYTQVCTERRVHELSATDMAELVRVMHRRIRATLFGRGKEIELDTGFEVIADHGVWKMIRETGAHARYGMGQADVTAFVTLNEEKDGRYHYSLGRLSDAIPFPLPKLYGDLNQAEGIPEGDTDRWGGSDTGGGSPRLKGSALNPRELAEVIDRRLTDGSRCNGHQASRASS